MTRQFSAFSMLSRIFFLTFSILIICIVSGHAKNVFINKVWFLQETNNFYTKLHLKKELSDSVSLDFLKDKVDSTIFKDYYLTRKRLPEAIALQYFDLECLQNVDIYSIDHENITSTSLLRIEYYEDMIEGMFIAVFENNQTLDLENLELDFYAISQTAENSLQKGFKQNEISKSQWDNSVKQKIPFEKEDLLQNHHIEIKNHGKDKFTILSLHEKNSTEYVTFLIEHQGDSIKIHHQLKNDFVFWDIIAVPLLKNNKPILLLEIIIPETDFTGYVLAEYDGFQYKLNHEMIITI